VGEAFSLDSAFAAKATLAKSAHRGWKAAPSADEKNDLIGSSMDIFTNPDESAVKQLLSESGLPVADITAQHLQHFFGCGSGQELEGLVGLELYGEVALLRSLAVAAAHRSAGLGSRLVAHAERYAQDHGVKSLYLLTTTAESFFLRRGYIKIPREEAPAAIMSTKEFAGICPLSSAFMVKQLWSQPL
jgi:amino-acid N-acetyltransferase